MRPRSWGKLAPYRGYCFKILTQQGSRAPAGKYKYVINGHMLAGFALVAWPEEWGNSGVMTFMVNQEGKVYQKNWGKNRPLAAAMTTYDPQPRMEASLGGRPFELESICNCGRPLGRAVFSEWSAVHFGVSRHRALKYRFRRPH